MVDYSKWARIEISDDEDDTHPNIDTASLFRWRHEARVEREREREKEKAEIKNKKKETEEKIKELEKKKTETPDITIEQQLEKLKFEKNKLDEKEKEIIIAEKKAPWNVDTISKEGWSKTVINKSKEPEDTSKLSEEELQKRYKDFVEKYEEKCKEFGLLKKFDDAKNFLMQNPELVCEEASNYLTIWCLNLEMEGKHNLMEHISQQVIALHYILELSRQMKVDPRSCVSSFFTKIQQADQTYIDCFNDEVKSFKTRIVNRAKVKLQEALNEYEEEEKQNRLGPGGLDPLEVIETLPEDLRKCFETRDTAMLNEVLLKMDPQEARYHMKRCVDSGLWVTDANKANANEQEENQDIETPKDTNNEKTEDANEATYSEAKIIADEQQK